MPTEITKHMYWKTHQGGHGKPGLSLTFENECMCECVCEDMCMSECMHECVCVCLSLHENM